MKNTFFGPVGSNRRSEYGVGEAVVKPLLFCQLLECRFIIKTQLPGGNIVTYSKKILAFMAFVVIGVLSNQSFALSCSATANSWGNGYVVSVIVTNNENSAINDWSVNLLFNQAPAIVGSWSATTSIVGNQVVASNAAWNGSIDAGGIIIFGFQGTHNGDFQLPTCTASESASSSVASSLSPSSSPFLPSSSQISSTSSATSASAVSLSSRSSDDSNTSGNEALVVQENQTGFCRVQGSIDNDNNGFTGDGFANSTNALGAQIVWQINVASAGNYILDWRYANGSGASRTASVSFGNAQSDINFPTTGAWDSWTVDSANIYLNRGDNTITLAANTGSGLANIDYLSIQGNGLSATTCMDSSSSSSATNADGDISITDLPTGWASVNGSTRGGGINLAEAVTVDSMDALQREASGSNSKIILVTPGNYNGILKPGANKTIIGIAPGVTLNGNISITGSDVYNVIIRNLAVRGLPCGSYDDCKNGDDAVYIGQSAHHIWLDHLDIADGQDGNCDVTRAADNVTISWTKFHYTYDKEHRYSNLIAGSDSEAESTGKLNITYMNNWWGDRVNSRQPRGRFGKIHMLNNYHQTGGSQIHGVGYNMSLIAENSYYEEPGQSIFTDMGSPLGWRGIGNAGNASNMNDSRGTVFSIPYQYTAMPASQVKQVVTSSNCGAGNTCKLAISEGSSSSTNTTTTADCNSINNQTILTVAKDGSGQFNTVQSAINRVSTSNSNPVQIRIKPGVYREKLVIDRPHITFCGQAGQQAATILTYNDTANTANGSGGTLGTFGSTSVAIKANDISMENLTVENSNGPGIQAVAMRIQGDRIQFRHCRFLGYQDTLYVHSGTQYFRDSFVMGTVDFIFGAATAVFENSTIHSIGEGTALTAPSTDASTPFGLVFLGGKTTADSSVRSGHVALGRNWRPYGAATYIGVELGAHISAVGWVEMGSNILDTARFSEYKNTGPGANPSARVWQSKELTASEAAVYTVENIFGSWVPSYSD